MFISYAQNFEDVLLWRALKHVEQGFYIDIGAHDPDVHSVSRAFFERGWKGLHVEPVARHADALRAARPGDEVVQAAIAPTEGSIPFYDIPDTGLSTGKEDIARLHERSGFDARRIDVPSIRLSTLLDRCAAQEVHWLKIDVEDMERDVIESWSPSPVRPWIVVVESTVPLSTKPNFADWETLILELGYQFAYFDGLNRFYVHETRSELKESLTCGANVFDDFSVGGSTPCARMLNGEIVRLSQELGTLRGQADLERAAFSRATEAWEVVSGTLSAELERKKEAIVSQEAFIGEQLSHLVARDSRIAEQELLIAELSRALVTAAERSGNAAQEQAEHDARQPGIPARIWSATVSGGNLLVRRPKAFVRLLLEHALLWIRRRPRVLAFVHRSIRLVPPLERHLLAFARARANRAALPDARWAMDPDPHAHEQWRALLGRAEGER